MYFAHVKQSKHVYFAHVKQSKHMYFAHVKQSKHVYAVHFVYIPLICSHSNRTFLHFQDLSTH